MQWFLNLSIRVKLLLGFGLMLVLLATVSVTAYRGIRAIQESQARLYQEDFADAVDLKDMRSNQNGTRAALLTMILLAKRSDQERWHQEIKDRFKESTETIQNLLGRNRGDPKHLSKLKEFAAVSTPYQQTVEAQVIPLIYEGKIEEAKKLILGIQLERQEKMRSLADELVADAENAARTAVAQAEQRASEAVRLFGLIGVVALLLGVGMAVFLDRILREVSREIRQGVSVLGASASEILATTTQVAAGAAETAAAVSETTTTVEEVKQTAQVASQKAKYVA
ncbi:MAG: MCP four helix bundle domain-containing protein, partial [candidate division NC10 bacterium]|nr:MCP four helix bundle domain-containing protein [candidate division NC10 bacterium]